jgi:hypothetical protein
MYEITPQQHRIARELGVHIFPSDKSKYKIDVYDWNGCYILSCGASKYYDYFLYKKKYGKDYAEERRRLYKIRHQKDLGNLGSKGYYAWHLLWAG